jgi:tetratricopeptide (TPR) repeat protein
VYEAEDPLEAYNRGLEHLDYNEPDLAIEAFTQAMRLKPSSVHSWFGRGFAHAMRGDLEQAVADYTDALRLDPRYVAAYQNRAAAYRQLGRLDEARQDEARLQELRSMNGAA